MAHEGKLLSIIGNIGIGKTTLSRALQRAGGFFPALEEHDTRPFQKAFAKNLAKYAFPNQVDYLLFRADQEGTLRRDGRMGILDGGLDLDFEVFTRLFRQKKYLSEAEFSVCERLYRLLRQSVQPPDLYLYLYAPLPVIDRRLAERGRVLRIAQAGDLEALETLLLDWVGRLGDSQVLMVDAGVDTFCSTTEIAALVEQIAARLSP